MKGLLDTHTMVWYIDGDSRLSSIASAYIQDASKEIFISPAAYWEVAIKVSLGKWKLNRPYEELIDHAMNTYKFQVLPILPEHTTRLLGLLPSR